ncbi:MAG TPA: hypothetical protein VNQ90_08500 [Chthoniobacteraceae bacterium]|nr:hypothetical protein [Chthoniobacteraceae bacterium]
MMRLPPQRTRGFSLVDLLVVLAVVATLLFLLAPAFSAAREHRSQARCVANLRQIGVGLALYVQDHRVYPYHITGSTRWHDGSSDPASFFAGPYVGSVPRLQQGAKQPTPSARGGLFDCPAFGAKEKEGLGPEGWINDFFDYGQNYSLCGRTPAGIRQPGKTVAVVEGGHYGRVKADRTKGLTYTPKEALNPGGTSWNQEPTILRYPHHGKANFLFLDGHVALHAPDELNENWFFER